MAAAVRAESGQVEAGLGALKQGRIDTSTESAIIHETVKPYRALKIKSCHQRGYIYLAERL